MKYFFIRSFFSFIFFIHFLFFSKIFIVRIKRKTKNGLNNSRFFPMSSIRYQRKFREFKNLIEAMSESSPTQPTLTYSVDELDGIDANALAFFTREEGKKERVGKMFFPFFLYPS